MRNALLLGVLPLVACGVDEEGASTRNAPVDECGHALPTCDDGSSAVVWEQFGAAGSCDTGSVNGGTWTVFSDASEPSRPITEAIVRVTDLRDDGLGVAAVAVGGQFGSLGITDCTSNGAVQLCSRNGAIADPGEWFRWTIAGVNQYGPILELSTSHDAVTWSKVAASDQLGLVFQLSASTYCPGGFPPPPCGTLRAELSDGIYVCRSSL